jgi:hypothetical protein
MRSERPCSVGNNREVCDFKMSIVVNKDADNRYVADTSCGVTLGRVSCGKLSQTLEDGNLVVSFDLCRQGKPCRAR